MNDMDEDRMDIIGRNGNNGEHYAEVNGDRTGQLTFRTDGKEHKILHFQPTFGHSPDSPYNLCDYKLRTLGQAYQANGRNHFRLTNADGGHTPWSPAKVYVARPRAVQAIQFTGDNHEALAKDLGLVTWADATFRLMFNYMGDTFIVYKDSWVVRMDDGNVTVMTNTQFTETYEIGFQ